MDWENLNADVEMIIGTHYTPGRSGMSIDKVVLHHNAGNLSVQDCYDVWQSREASAHYQVTEDGTVGQLVNDWDTAWHAGDWDANITSIGIEHADVSSDPWALSDATVDAGAHLVAAICKRYGLGRPAWGENVFCHSDFCATTCPASLGYGGSQHDEYMARAQAWYDAMRGGSEPEPVQPSQPTEPAYDESQPLYAACTVGMRWLDPMRGTVDTGGSGDDFAGVMGEAMGYLAIDGVGQYRAQSVDNGWLPYVDAYDPSDLENGCAGDGSAITALEIPNDGIRYQVHVLGGGWLDWMRGNSDEGGSSDWWAGNGEPIDAVRIVRA